MVDVRLLTEKDIEASNELHNEAYDRRRTLNQWRWEFLPHRLECNQIPFAVADDGGRIVGTQALIPIQMIDREGVFWTAKSEETLVASAYRGQKLFERMYDLLFEFAQDHRFRYIWGFTPATKSFKRIGFDVPGQTAQLFYPFSARSVSTGTASASLKSDPSLRSRLLRPLYGPVVSVARIWSATQLHVSARKLDAISDGDRISLRTLESAPLKAGELCRRFVARWGGTTVFRDENYLNWRIFGNPYLKAIVRAAYLGDELVGWIAYSVGDDGMGYIIDLIVATPKSVDFGVETVARYLLRDAVVALRAAGAFGIRGWRVNNHPFDQLVFRAAKYLGFWYVKKGFDIVVRVDPVAETKARDNWFDDWYVSRIYTEGLAG